MKFLPLLALISAPAFADTKVTEFCTNLGKFASDVQNYHQLDGSLSELMDGLSKQETTDIAYTIVFDAFEQPVWSDPLMRQATVTQFRNSWELKCFQSLKDQPAN